MPQRIQFLEIHRLKVNQPNWPKDIVLNPEPDLDAVPVEAEQRIMDGRKCGCFGNLKAVIRIEASWACLNYPSLPGSLHCNLDRIFYYKTIWPMACVLPFSVSLIFRSLTFSTIGTLISHLFYNYQDTLRFEIEPIPPIIYKECLLGVIITSLVLVHHLGR